MISQVCKRVDVSTQSINQQDRSKSMIVRMNADNTIYYLPICLTYQQQKSHNCYSEKLS